jgi:nitrous oxide reductase accessory protein NosL
MAIEDARFAAGYVNRAGQTCAFDDLGDFFAWMVAHQDDQALPLWVHDYEDGSWVDGSAAWFVCGSRLHTPMAGAIVALRTHDRALAFSVQHGGKVLDFKGTLEKEHNKS